MIRKQKRNMHSTTAERDALSFEKILFCHL